MKNINHAMTLQDIYVFLKASMQKLTLSTFFQREHDFVHKHCDVDNFPYDFKSGKVLKNKKVKIIGKIGKRFSKFCNKLFGLGHTKQAR